MRSYGFTIVETLIVLAVTGALFLSAAIMIAGRQSRTAFDQSIRQVQSQIQQVINEVSVGYFPDTNFSCSASPSGPVLSTAASGGQGTNSGCIFNGKAIQFAVDDTEPQTFAVHTLTGLQKNSSGQDVKTLIDSMTRSVTPTTLEKASGASIPDITTTDILQNGLTVSDMWFNDGAGDVQVGTVAFVTALPSYEDSGVLKPGVPAVLVVPVNGSALHKSTAEGADALGSSGFYNRTSSPRDPVNGVSVCFASGGTKQSGLITIGGGGRPLDINLKIFSASTTCGR